MTKMLDVLENYLIGMGYAYERLDERIRGSERQRAIDRFEERSESLVFLLSSRVVR